MPKRKTSCQINVDASKRYRPTLSQEEKAANHRRSQAAHYARNPDIRERRRIQVAERRAAKKMERRRWDPPKGKNVAENTEDEDFDADEPGARISRKQTDCSLISDDQDLGEESAAVDLRAAHSESSLLTWDLNADVLDPTSEVEASRGTHASPTSDEWVATQALATLAALAEPGADVSRCTSQDSILERAMLLGSSDGNSTSAIDLHQTIPPAAAIYPALAAQTYAACHAPTGVTMAAAGNGPDVRSPPISEGVGPLSRVQAAQARVAALNSGNLTRPTSADAAQWGRRSVPGGICLSDETIGAIQKWRMCVWRGK
ncbi:hypothetical protein B0H10DRAFT_1968994 [Mycena sp. CBHHK59/15]|nr:hypothetical protein B0H10DRAFT_1968994 [Mycena sp. CBHHK59/15]